ncbi:hypothetical protein IWW37_005611 [Coemansia sp. RSA 2050]|nr:hypothetical protein IWW37_005611 [Coemansia sp. RSA 2050]KAJ2729506.1 hypothetical protein IW152_005605 [Coemansia sp. BCRC 34962]
MGTKGGDTAAERFIDAANDSLQLLTASVGDSARTAASELVGAIDGCQYSTEAQLSTLLDLLQKTQTAASDSKGLLSTSKAAISDCLNNRTTTMQSLREAASMASEALHAIETTKSPVDEKRNQYVKEMDRRNEKFEDRLRTDHEEFRRMHARRLTSVLQQTQL